MKRLSTFIILIVLTATSPTLLAQDIVDTGKWTKRLNTLKGKATNLGASVVSGTVHLANSQFQVQFDETSIMNAVERAKNDIQKIRRHNHQITRQREMMGENFKDFPEYQNELKRREQPCNGRKISDNLFKSLNRALENNCGLINIEKTCNDASTRVSEILSINRVKHDILIEQLKNGAKDVLPKMRKARLTAIDTFNNLVDTNRPCGETIAKNTLSPQCRNTYQEVINGQFVDAIRYHCSENELDSVIADFKSTLKSVKSAYLITLNNVYSNHAKNRLQEAVVGRELADLDTTIREYELVNKPVQADAGESLLYNSDDRKPSTKSW